MIMPPDSSDTPATRPSRPSNISAVHSVSPAAYAGCHGALVLAIAVYVAAVCAGALLDVKTPILNGVWPCLVAAALLGFYGGVVLPRADRLVRIVEAACLVVALGLSLACLSYLAPITDLPLRDRELIWIDNHLGFDWLRVMQGLDHRQPLLAVLDGAYATFTSQLIGTVLVLIATRRTRELDRFFITFICASVFADIASILVPTLGPMMALAGDSNFAHLPMLGRETGHIVLALRNGNLKTVDLDAIDGIITFPSLHAAVAVIVPYTLRWCRPLFWPVLLLDSIMCISAVPSGNHYLSDVFGGLAVALLAIMCGRAIQQLVDRTVIGWNGARPKRAAL